MPQKYVIVFMQECTKGQNAAGLEFGGTKLAHAPEIDKDLDKMIKKGIPVYLVTEDARERGLSSSDMVAGIKEISRKTLPQLLDQFDQIWHW